jgi:hypothetical protein
MRSTKRFIQDNSLRVFKLQMVDLQGFLIPYLHDIQIIKNIDNEISKMPRCSLDTLRCKPII